MNPRCGSFTPKNPMENPKSLKNPVIQLSAGRHSGTAETHASSSPSRLSCSQAPAFSSTTASLPLADQGAFQWLVELRHRGSLVIRKAETDGFLERYHKTLARAPLEPLPNSKSKPSPAHAPPPASQATRLDERTARQTTRRAFGVRLRHEDGALVLFQPDVFDASLRRSILRDVAAEQAALERLAFLRPSRPRASMADPPFLLTASKFPILPAGWSQKAGESRPKGNWFEAPGPSTCA